MTRQRPHAELRLWSAQTSPGFAAIVAAPNAVVGADRDAVRSHRIDEDREHVGRLGEPAAERFPGSITVAAAVKPGAPEPSGIGVAGKAHVNVEVRHGSTTLLIDVDPHLNAPRR
jgi:hypothetical protein